ncbi:MAG: baeRF3 domain-containing protein [Ginsengibacter sp.]
MYAEKYRTDIPALALTENQPCISLMIPFDPKINSKASINYALKKATDKIKHDLYVAYDAHAAETVFKKLKNVIAHLDFSTLKKAITIYVSSQIEKVYYLNIELKEKIVVGNTFEIRDIVENKYDTPRFLILTISGNMQKIYEASGNKLQLIMSNKIDQVKRDLPEPVANFSDATSVKEIRLKNFLHYIDLQLSHILAVYSLPLLVMAPKKTMGYFQHLTKHLKNITGFIHGNFDAATESQLLKALEPHISNWKAIKEKHILNLLKIEEDKRRLIKGINDVWMHTSRNSKQFLVVEKGFCCTAFTTENGEIIFSDCLPKHKPVLRDAVDIIIEKVLEGGGDIEFVDDLKEFSKIALIKSSNINYRHTFKKNKNLKDWQESIG